MIYRHVFSIGIQAPPNSEIYFQKTRDFIHYLKYDLGWNIVGVSFDGYNSVDMRQQMELDGFKATIISLDRDDKGYNTFRNALAEKRIGMIDCNELTKEITALERNAHTGKIDHPAQSVRKDSEGRIIKSVGKDEADSLCGAVYNASISVNVDELDHMESITLTDGNVTLQVGQNAADQYFGFSTNALDGSVNMLPTTNSDVEEQLANDIQREIKNTQNILHKLKKDSPNTKLSDQQLIDMYSDFNDSGFLIF